MWGEEMIKTTCGNCKNYGNRCYCAPNGTCSHYEEAEHEVVDNRELFGALKRIATEDQFKCLGCGYEHNCSIHGCAIIRKAIDVIERLNWEE